MCRLYLAFPQTFSFLVMAFWLVAANQAQAAIEMADAVGDALGIHDITSVSTEVLANQLVFTVNLADDIAPPFPDSPRSIITLIDIDVDQNVSTGATSEFTRFAVLGNSGLGAEFLVDAFSFPFGDQELLDRTGGGFVSIGTVDVTYQTQSLTIAIDLVDLGRDAEIDYGVIVGDIGFASPSDGLVGSTTVTVATIPEPLAVAVWLVIATICCSVHRRRPL